MTSEDKVRRVYPSWYSLKLPSRGILGRWAIRDETSLNQGRGRSERGAWADAWRRIQAARKE